MTLDRLATEMMAGFYRVSEDSKEIKQRLTNIERDVSEIKVDLKAHGKAIDADAIVLIKHGNRLSRHHTRISRLEKLAKR